MLLTLRCPECDTQLEVSADLAGTHDQCPSCGCDITIPPPTIEPGTSIGNFQIGRKLGAGGMGDVFLATQLSMDRQVALKVLPAALTRNGQLVERFLHEVRLSARLEHPNIVTAFEAGEDTGVFFLAMSYVDGETLQAILEREKALPERRALDIAVRVADALAYAWDEFRVLHRDIKPANIMLDRSGRPKLMDMGISKSLAEDSTLTATGMVVGTPNYMSPEQAKNAASIDFRADIYSLGATLYQLVTGTRPFAGTSALDMMVQHATEPLPPANTRNPDVSVNCAMLLDMMMAKSPADRHGSWRELIQDVERVLAGKPPVKGMHEGATTVVTRVPARAVCTKAGAPGQGGDAKTGAPSDAHGPAETCPPLHVIGRAGPRAATRDEPPASTPQPTRQPERRAPPDGVQPDARTPPPRAAPGKVTPPPVIPLSKRRRAVRRRRLRRRLAGPAIILGALVAAVVAGMGTLRFTRHALRKLQQQVRPFEPAVRHDAPEDEPTPEPEPFSPEAFADDAGAAAAPDADAPDSTGRHRAGAPGTRLGNELLSPILAGAVSELLASDFDAAAQTIGRARLDERFADCATELAALSVLVRKAAKTKAIIRDSFRHDLRRPITIAFTTGPEKLMIHAVGDETITASVVGSRQPGGGPRRRSFAVDELAPSEKLKRLPTETVEPGIALARGLLHIKTGDRQAAERELTDLPSAFQSAILAGLEHTNQSGPAAE